MRLADVPALEVEAAERPLRLAESIARVHSSAHYAATFWDECELSVLAVAKRLRIPLTYAEQASAAQEVALVEMRRFGRMPERGESGLTTLQLAARNVLTRHSQDWRDVDSGYRVKLGGKPVKVADVKSRDAIEADAREAAKEGRPVGWLAEALHRAESTETRVAPLPSDVAHLAGAVLVRLEREWLAGENTAAWSKGVRRDVLTALRLAMGASVATESAMSGRTAMALHKSKGRGEAVLRTAVEPGELLRIVRAVARESRPARDPDALALADDAQGAAWLVDETADRTRRTVKRATTGTRTDRLLPDVEQTGMRRIVGDPEGAGSTRMRRKRIRETRKRLAANRRANVAYVERWQAMRS